MNLRSFFARTATLIVAASCGSNLLASGSTLLLDADLSNSTSKVLDEADALKLAYKVLSRANNCYAGSRVLAMDYIRAAGKPFGLKLEGYETGTEDLAISDQRFQTAKSLLEQVRAQLAAKGLTESVSNVDEALKEITLALTLEPVPPKLDRPPIFLTETDREILRLSYQTLQPGNHRSRGHRRAAMFKIQAAARLAGVSLAGDGKGNEDQRITEVRLQVAGNLLEQLRSNLTLPEQGAVRVYVELALDRLHRAAKESGSAVN